MLKIKKWLLWATVVKDKGYRSVTRWPFTTNKICTVGNKKGSNYLGETG